MNSVLAVLLVLGVLIAFHEFGHFIVARLLGMGVRVFSLGFGPRLASFTRGKTRYQLSTVPLGGYVQLVGEREGDELPENFTDKESFSLRPAWQRTLVVFAGPLFNILLAWFIFTGVFGLLGKPSGLAPVIDEVQADSPAAAAGILSEDRIVQIGGEDIQTWGDVIDAIAASKGAPLTFVLDRDGQEVVTRATPKLTSSTNPKGETEERFLVGILVGDELAFKPLDPGETAIGLGFERTVDVVTMMVSAVAKIISGQLSLKENLGGPIMIAGEVSNSAKSGLVPLLFLTALISINLGIINLLPIPVLDGGHILFYALETIIRRPISPAIKEVTTKIGLSMLLSLMALAIYIDLARIYDWLPIW